MLTSHWTQDRLRGMFLGHALGDAMGAPYEFRYNQNKEITDLITHTQRHRSQWQGTRFSALAQVTDDTEMTLALFHALTEAGQYDSERVVIGYLDWVNSGNTFLGKNTRKLMKGLKTTRGFYRRREKEDLTRMESNGCLMRASPLVLLAEQASFKEDVLTDVNLTNPNPTCRECVWLYVQILRDLLEGKVKPLKLFRQYRKQATQAAVKQAFADVQTGVDRSVENIKTKSEADLLGTSRSDRGWVVHAFYCALYALVHLEKVDYHELMMEILDWQGDTDTNMAIAGAIIGAGQGLKAMKRNEFARQNLELILACDSTDGDFPRDQRYHPQVYIKQI